ncbi:MAG TPA: JAB domain-containing protein [Bacteroidales bacterium]
MVISIIPGNIISYIEKHSSSRYASRVASSNHPSGNIQPSEADNKITKKSKDCGLLLDVAVLDHIIVGDDRFCNSLSFFNYFY